MISDTSLRIRYLFATKYTIFGDRGPQKYTVIEFFKKCCGALQLNVIDSLINTFALKGGQVKSGQFSIKWTANPNSMCLTLFLKP